MSKIARSVLISELNALTGHECGISKVESDFNSFWTSTFDNYGGISITEFPDAKKAAEIVISDYGRGKENNLPKLKIIYENDVKRNVTSSYVIVVDGKIAKIGALKSGIKGNSFAQYLSGITGNPSKRNLGVYTFILSMLRDDRKVEVYHVTMEGLFDANINTISGELKAKVHCSAFDIESINVGRYKEKNSGSAPFLNLKERNANYPKVVDELFNLINQRSIKVKKYAI